MLEACVRGETQTFRNILSAGCIIPQPIMWLSVACQLGHVDMVRMFVLEANINVETKNNQRDTPLRVSCQNNQVHVARFLFVEGKASVLEPDGNHTHLMETCQRGCLETARFLLREGKVDVNQQSRDGKTALMIACNMGNFELVRMLFKKAKPNQNLRTRHNRSALSFVEKRPYEPEPISRFLRLQNSIDFFKALHFQKGNEHSTIQRSFRQQKLFETRLVFLIAAFI